MATHTDSDIDNQSGTSLIDTPDDLNLLLDAVRSNWSGTTTPVAFGDYQMWVDTTTNILKLRLPDTSVISICNVDTGQFFDVTSTANATTLDTLSTSTAATTNIILRRDANGAITGDLATGFDLNGNAAALGIPTGVPSYIFDSSNLTGDTAVETTAGTKLIASVDLRGVTTSATKPTSNIRFRPFRKGTIRVILRCDTTVGSVKVSASHTPASVTTWVMVSGTEFTVDLTVDHGDYILIDTSLVTAVSTDSVCFGIAGSGWDRHVTDTNASYKYLRTFPGHFLS